MRAPAAGVSDYAEIVEPDDTDYSSPTTRRDFEVARERVTLVSVLGEGQFGDVHKGVYVDSVSHPTHRLIDQSVSQYDAPNLSPLEKLSRISAFAVDIILQAKM